ncbi:1-aminocyclopropane-1-carboxylate deaminase/D-cysteine desulfhydrase [Simiduia agarivorans]|uniref:1-aminocyclopropane-1-carboxylate deaminase/D-cysteine desulfhydrase n=1 Tax=Simiduia agarivorans TaxID=447471 RepID=UPI0004A5FECE|nr:pyridoxal-phosphate dependent enzyme [Simiduia agarivorans]
MPPLSAVADGVPCELLNWSVARAAGVEIFVRRDDLLPAWGQGNKFYKLYYNLQALPSDAVCVSFGGPYSNHLHALALVAQKMCVHSVGIVRGYAGKSLTPTLADAQAAGMQLVFVSRRDYARYSAPQVDAGRHAWCQDKIGIRDRPLHIIPEGGANAEGLCGAQVLAERILAQPIVGPGRALHALWLAVGTGTTLAGLVNGIGGDARVQQVVGVPVIGPHPEQGYHPLSESIKDRCGINSRWRLETGFSLGGYAKTTPEYLAFLQDFYRETGVQLDHVYTGKLFWALRSGLISGSIERGTRLLAMHTGGLQGLRGLQGQ